MDVAGKGDARRAGLQESEGLQRVGFLVVLPQLLRNRGVDPAHVLRAVGLGVHALDDPEGVIPYTAMGRLIQVAADETGCAYLGLLVGQCIGFASLGLIGELMRNAPTLGVALQDLAIHQHRHSRGSLVYLLRQNDHVVFGYAVYQPEVAANPHLCDGAAAAAFNIVRGLLQSDRLDGMEVLISRAPPENPEQYRRFFGVKVHYNAEQTGVMLPEGWRGRPVLGADAQRRSALEERVSAYAPTGELDLVEKMRRAVRVGVATDRISGDEIAAQLGVARRTLRRGLAARGVTFQTVLDETRFELAAQLLANTELGVADVGLIVRYADPSIFTRAFTRWSGVTPSEWRWNNRLGGTSHRCHAAGPSLSKSA